MRSTLLAVALSNSLSDEEQTLSETCTTQRSVSVSDFIFLLLRKINLEEALATYSFVNQVVEFWRSNWKHIHLAIYQRMVYAMT